MSEPILTFADRIYQRLIAMKQDEIFDIDKKVTPENKELFISVVKRFIEDRYGDAYGFTIEFNSTYSRLRKLYNN